MPKGIVITGRNICHYLRSANALYRITDEDVVFQGASVAFDLSMEEIWIPFMVGARIVVASAEMLGEVDRLPDVLTEAGVTVLDTVPTLLGMLPRDVPSLRLIILGGEACPATLALRWWRPGRQIFNSYGPTESTVVATAAEVRPGAPVTIGRPIPNYTCYVVDDRMRLCPRGVEGELLIGGPGVARGYLNRDALTAEKFIANPFGGADGDPILYRSGDAVALDQSGEIVFRGRIDDQVKIRGFRVELGEIEVKLSQCPGVSQATVVLRAEDGIDQLVAFLVPEAGADAALLEPRHLRETLRQDLPRLYGARALRAGRRHAALALRQGRPQGAQGRAAQRSCVHGRAGGTPHRHRGNAARGGSGRSAAAGDPVRRRFLRGPRRPLAAGGALYFRRAPEPGAGWR